METQPSFDATSTTTDSHPDPDGSPPGQGLIDRLRSRVSKDIRNAMVDPSVQHSGDFDIVVAGMSQTSRDRVQNFASLIMAVRITTTLVSILLVATSHSNQMPKLAIWTGLVVAYAVVRTLRPIKYSNDVQSLMRVLFEVLFHTVAVVLTGGWESPLVFTLLTAVTVAGLARGYGFSLRVAIATCLTVTFPFVDGAPEAADALIRSTSWSGIVILVAIVAGYARRISGEADRERELALDRLDRLADANSLLFSLHRVTQTLPASLDLGDVLDSTIARIKSLVSYDSVAILLFDEVDAHWEVVRHQGLHVSSRLGPTELPNGLRSAIAKNGVVHISEGMSDKGLSGRAGSGIYTVLEARGAIIGLLAIEHGEENRFVPRDTEVIKGFTAPAALALDNARWFARLRTVGADEERTRIARDLHDRIGQSLAYLAFELDRLVDENESGKSLTEPLSRLRDDVRGVIREVRDTLYDLRTDVSETHGMGEVLEEYVTRVAERSSLVVQIESDKSHRLPLLQEREMWRVTQEALANVEKHAQATAVRIVWRCDGQRAYVDVTDNGIGFAQGKAGRLDSYGMLGMRERAASIGAVLEVVSAPGRGTRIRCSLNPTEVTRQGANDDEQAAETIEYSEIGG